MTELAARRLVGWIPTPIPTSAVTPNVLEKFVSSDLLIIGTFFLIIFITFVLSLRLTKSFDKFGKSIIIIGILLVSFSFFYYLVIFLPQKERAKTIQQEQEQIDKLRREEGIRILLEACLENAQTTYQSQWNSQCRTLGRQEGCSLPQPVSNTVNAYLKDLKDECFKKYP